MARRTHRRRSPHPRRTRLCSPHSGVDRWRRRCSCSHSRSGMRRTPPADTRPRRKDRLRRAPRTRRSASGRSAYPRSRLRIGSARVGTRTSRCRRPPSWARTCRRSPRRSGRRGTRRRHRMPGRTPHSVQGPRRGLRSTGRRCPCRCGSRRGTLHGRTLHRARTRCHTRCSGWGCSPGRRTAPRTAPRPASNPANRCWSTKDPRWSSPPPLPLPSLRRPRRCPSLLRLQCPRCAGRRRTRGRTRTSAR